MFLFATLFFAGTLAAMTPEERLAEMKITLPAVAKPAANYVPAVRTGSLLYISGQISRDEKGGTIAGKVGSDLTAEQAAAAARRTAIALIAVLKAELGDLRRVKRIVRVGGFVNSAPGFTQQSAVMNGCSDLLVAVFGDAGKHARTSIGVAELPVNAAVESDLIAEITD